MINDEVFYEFSDFIIYHSSFMIHRRSTKGAGHMFRRLLSGLAVWALIVGGSFAWSETSGAASQKVNTDIVLAPAERRSGTLQTQPESAVEWQMLALERRARVDMLLYPGQFGQGEWASTAHPLGAIALSLSAGE